MTANANKNGVPSPLHIIQNMNKTEKYGHAETLHRTPCL